MAIAYRALPPDDPEDGSGPGSSWADLFLRPYEDLAFSLELWDGSETTLCEVLAVTSSVGIGYAMYYSTVGQYSDATVILRHRKKVLARWSSTTR